MGVARAAFSLIPDFAREVYSVDISQIEWFGDLWSWYIRDFLILMEFVKNSVGLLKLLVGVMNFLFYFTFCIGISCGVSMHLKMSLMVLTLCFGVESVVFLKLTKVCTPSQRLLILVHPKNILIHLRWRFERVLRWFLKILIESLVVELFKEQILRLVDLNEVIYLLIILLALLFKLLWSIIDFIVSQRDLISIVWSHWVVITLIS